MDWFVQFVTFVLKLLEVVTPIVAVFVGNGLVVKYAPFMKWFPNEAIRLLNGLISFFLIFGGTTSAAHAGFFGDVIAQVGIWGKIGGSVVLTGLAQWFFESHLRGPLDKMGIRKAT